MFKFLVVFISLQFSTSVLSQNYKVTYSISKDILAQKENGSQAKIATLNFEGQILANKNRFIYYKVPLYLKSYPNKSVTTFSDNMYSTISIPCDTIQGIYYNDIDSLIIRYRPDGAPHYTGNNIMRKVDKNYSRKWEFLKEEKTINSFKCQKAQLYNSNKVLVWEVWFTDKVLFPIGPVSIRDLPGLVVQAFSPITSELFILKSIEQLKFIDTNKFWPNEFRVYTFTEQGVLRDRN